MVMTVLRWLLQSIGDLLTIMLLIIVLLSESIRVRDDHRSH